MVPKERVNFKRIDMTKHELSRPSIEKIAWICKQCLEHDSSWDEFKEQVQEKIKLEDKMIKMLSEGIR
jgi:regulator of sigma D